jgi:hypothetical protein
LNFNNLLVPVAVRFAVYRHLVVLSLVPVAVRFAVYRHLVVLSDFDPRLIAFSGVI